MNEPKKNDLLYKIKQFDTEWVFKLNNKIKSSKFLIFLIRFFSFFGRETIWLFLINFFIFVYVKFEYFLAFGNGLLVSLFIINTIKLISKRKRPYIELEQITPLERHHKSAGFPSWHSFNASLMACIIVNLSNSIAVWILTIIFSILIGISRIALGMHYPTDVIVGYGLGFIGFFISQKLINPWLFLIEFINKISPIPILNNQLNIFLAENWFVLIVIGTFCGIFLDGIFAILKDFTLSKILIKKF